MKKKSTKINCISCGKEGLGKDEVRNNQKLYSLHQFIAVMKIDEVATVKTKLQRE